MGPHPEVLLPFAAPRSTVRTVTHVRSTVIISSLDALRSRGRRDDYLGLLDPEHRDEIASCVAGTWIALETARAHYEACERLGFTASEQIEIGREVGTRVEGTFIATLVRTAKLVGVTPWFLLSRARALGQRTVAGGDVCVTKTGPKDALAEIIGNPLHCIPYYRNALRGAWHAGCSLFCTKVYITEIQGDGGPFDIAFRIAWA